MRILAWIAVAVLWSCTSGDGNSPPPSSTGGSGGAGGAGDGGAGSGGEGGDGAVGGFGGSGSGGDSGDGATGGQSGAGSSGEGGSGAVGGVGGAGSGGDGAMGGQGGAGSGGASGDGAVGGLGGAGSGGDFCDGDVGGLGGAGLGGEGGADAVDGCAASGDEGGTALPPLPPLDKAMARHWFSIPEMRPHDGAQTEGCFTYLGMQAGLIVRLDWGSLERTTIWPPGESDPVEGILASQDGRLVTVHVSQDGLRSIYVTTDGGQEWQLSDALETPAQPSRIAGFPGTPGVPGRMFSTCGGPTLDVSDDGGYHWSRAIKDGSCYPASLTLDTSKELLWFSCTSLEPFILAWTSVTNTGPVPSAWEWTVIPEFELEMPWSVVADPAAPHAVYFGGSGWLGRVHMGADGIPIGKVMWSVTDIADEAFTTLRGLWADPKQPGRLLSGGDGLQRDVDMVPPAHLFESVHCGKQPRRIPIEGDPNGAVTSIHASPDGSRLLVVVDDSEANTTGLYVLER